MNDNWKLDSIEIGFQKWGEDKGKYCGNIQFSNGENESFKFKIRPDLADKYIKLISTDIVIAADSLAERLIDSLGIRNPKPVDDDEG